MMRTFRPSGFRSPFIHLMLAAALVLLPVAAARGDMESQVRSTISAADLKQTSVGVMVMDANSGATLVAINADEPMIPASNMKLVTTAAALKILGPDFVFRTELRRIDPADWPAATAGAAPAAAPQPPKGTTLLIRGDGDPGLGDPELLRMHKMDVEQFLAAWVNVIEKAGIKEVETLVIDDRVFDRQYVHPHWPANQLSAWYCAQVAGISFYDNCVDVFVQAVSKGQPPLTRVTPATPYVQLANRATTVTQGDNTLWMDRRQETNEIAVRGQLTLNRRGTYNVTVHDPSIFFARTLAARLATRGIQVGQITRPKEEEHLPEGKLLLAVENELPMLVARCNKDSQNLFAEAMIKRVGRAVTGEPGGWSNGAAAMRLYLRGVLGARSASVIISDGSGLSRENRITPRAFVELLKAMHNDPAVSEIYRNSLSVGGKDGTLDKRFRSDLAGQVFGKSGYINGVSTLTGYLIIPDSTQPKGERVLAFSFLFNNFKAPVTPHTLKNLQDKLVKAIDRSAAPRRPAQAPSPVNQGG